MRSVGGVLISLSRPWAHRWINQLSLWRTASVTPDLRLPSQLQGITAPWPVLNYTPWWQRHMCVNNLPKVVTWKREAESWTRDLRSRMSNAITTTPPGHMEVLCCENIMQCNESQCCMHRKMKLNDCQQQHNCTICELQDAANYLHTKNGDSGSSQVSM